MKHLVLFVSILSLLFTWSNLHVNATDSQKTQGGPLNGSEKVMQLQNRVQNGVVPFTSAIFGPYVIRPERPYHLLLLFTATDDKYNCDICKKVAPELQLLGASYEAAKQLKVDTHGGLEIFFGVVEVATNEAAFKIFGLTSAPYLMYVAPDHSIDIGDALPRKKRKVEPQNLYNVLTEGIEAEHMAAFVKQHTGCDVVIRRSKTFVYMLFVVVLVAIALVVKLVLDHLDLVLFKMRRKELWMTVSLLFYGLSVSGMVFCIIRKPRLFSVDQKGNPSYFHPNAREQFVYEGLIVGGFDVGAAVFMILLSQWAVYVRHPMMRHLAVIGCALGFVFMYRQMTNTYKFKNPWYTGFMGV